MIKIHFYKWKSLVSRLIKLRTWWEYSHVAITIWKDTYEVWSITWWISDMKVIWTPNKYMYHKPLTQIDTIEISWYESMENKVKMFLDEQINLPYDWKGILWYIDSDIQQDAKKRYCSELVYIALCIIWRLKIGEKYPSPQRLYELLSQNK